MARNSQTTTINLEMSASQARQTLRTLEAEAKRLRQAIDQAVGAGDRNRARNLQRQLNGVNSAMRTMRTETASAEKVLQRLDKASPNELRKTIRTLTNDLNKMERGTAAFAAQAEKIRRVKAELANVNAELREQQTLWQRVKGSVAGFVAGVGAAVGSAMVAVNFGRKSVEDFAAMEQEMANVRKYSGMTTEQVAELNEAFKKMDTRTSRENLNLLAQDAGRLGKTSVEDILGFVAAADKINVALDDLGDGATLTLSKLSGMFGIEERFGTEQGLLKVGSVINELSQNCSASAPYIAEFTSRMGATGVQAKITIPQIMAFGAVLDTVGMNVEASSTAISQLITRIFTDPAKYATAAGLEVRKFTELLNTDANEAVLTLLESLNKAGGLEKLAPMFADMGEKGANSVKALGALASKIGDVRAQQQAANQAFDEGTSIDAEFSVQNNTVAASLEKRRNRIHELSVTLGEQLLPLQEAALDIGTRAMSALATVVAFIKEHIVTIGTLAAAIGIYRTAILLSTAATKLAVVAEKANALAMSAGRTVALACAAAYNTLAGNATRAAAANRALNATLSRSAWGAVLAVIGLVVGAIVEYMRKSKQAAEDEKRRIEERNAMIRESMDVTKRSNELAATEISNLKLLYAAATNDTLAKKERYEAAQKLINQYPSTFRNFSAEEIALGKARTAYDDLTKSILLNAKAKAAAEKVMENQKRILELEDALDEYRAGYREAEKGISAVAEENKKIGQLRHEVAKTPGGAQALSGIDAAAPGSSPLQYRSASGYVQQKSKNARGIDSTKADIAQLNASNDKLVSRYGGNEAFKGTYSTTVATAAPAPTAAPAATPSGGTSSGTSKSEKEAERRARAAEKEAEKAEKEAARADKEAKQREIERLRREKEMKEIQTRIDSVSGDADKATRERNLQRDLYDVKIEYLEKMRDVYSEDSEEYADYQHQIDKAVQERKLQTEEETLRDLERLQSEYLSKSAAERMSDEMAVLNTLHDKKLLSEEDFQKAKLAIEKKYADEGADVSKDSTRRVQSEFGDLVVNLYESFSKIFASLSENGKMSLEDLGSAVAACASLISAITQVATQYINAETDYRTAKISKSYDRQIELAKGNSKRQERLEEQKEKAIAEEKKKVAKKTFALQIATAIATTAASAIQAYAAALQVGGLAGLILAPIAASMAVAAGAVQIATINKQKQAAEASGYKVGGYTGDGPEDEPAGVVHKGEWVASARLLKNPATAPLIAMLDRAQRNNTIGSITPGDVSMSVAGRSGLTPSQAQRESQQSESAEMVAGAVSVNAAQSARLAGAVDRLEQRLSRPIVAEATIAGPNGVRDRLDRYDTLLKNKSRNK